MKLTAPFFSVPLLFNLLSISICRADLYEDRLRSIPAPGVPYMNSKDQFDQTDFNPNPNREYRERVYQFTYGFTHGDPSIAQSSECTVESLACWGNKTWDCSPSGHKRKVRLDELYYGMDSVDYCDVNIPRDSGTLACRVKEIFNLSVAGHFYYAAHCIDSAKQEQEIAIPR
jgi:hypothetical protein